jgi:glycerophosphoryl diester phosphodiesterase
MTPLPAVTVPSTRSPIERHASPLVFAHRGGRALGPENTLPAFDLGLGAGADGLEFDVHLSRDGIPVVHHDMTLDRCTNARGPVAERTADELARVDAAYRFAPELGFPWRGRGAAVPTLAEVLTRYPAVPMVVEVKSATDGTARAVVEVIRRADAVAQVCVGSFSVDLLRAVRRLEPAIATGAARQETQWALYRSWVGLGLGRVGYRAFQVPEFAGRLRVVSPALIRCAHESGLAFQVWTVNERRDMWRLLDWGVDALISDRPDVAVEVRDEWVGRRRQSEKRRT